MITATTNLLLAALLAAATARNFPTASLTDTTTSDDTEPSALKQVVPGEDAATDDSELDLECGMYCCPWDDCYDSRACCRRRRCDDDENGNGGRPPGSGNGSCNCSALESELNWQITRIDDLEE